MNKRIFITLAVTLVAGMILYKMPSQAAEEQPRRRTRISLEQPDAGDIAAADPSLAPMIARQRQAGPPERIKQLIAKKKAEREAEDKTARENFKEQLKQLTSKKKQTTDRDRFVATQELITYLDQANTRLEKRVRTLESRSKKSTTKVRVLEGTVPTEY